LSVGNATKFNANEFVDIGSPTHDDAYVGVHTSGATTILGAYNTSTAGSLRGGFVGTVNNESFHLRRNNVNVLNINKSNVWSSDYPFVINNNVTSLHQTYNITANTAFDTTYTNNHARPVYIDFTFSELIQYEDDVAYVKMYVDGSYCSGEGYDGTGGAGGQTKVFTEYNHLGCYVQSGQTYSFNSTTSGGASVALERVYLTVI